MQSLVSVIMPTYNRGMTIKRSIDSVLKQSYEKIELIIVDDGSSDNTTEIVKSYHDGRIKLISLDRNSGANVARNKGINVAKGKYIAFQDSDDEWLENKLEIQIKYMEETGKKVCYCPYILFNNGEVKVIPSHADNRVLFEEKIQETLRKGNVISTQTLVIHKEVVLSVGMFDESLYRLQDYEFVIRICQQYKIGYIDKPLVNVYRMSDSISSNRLALADACKKILIKHTEFVDFKSVLHLYLFNCKWYDTQKIYWEYLEEMLTIKRNGMTKENIDFAIQIKSDMSKWHTYLKKNIIKKKFSIYGAGNYGKGVYYTLKNMGLTPQCFWVTHRQKENRIDQIPVLELPSEMGNELSVIIAISKDRQEELCENLLSRGCTNYYVYPFC
ncbi:MAG: glycosyltransferase family 2 protein [Lachnospiraceae bacterium]|nr:glycosyltransferase family 2 protein [Lachnospiraceae bacterium]